MMGLILCLTNPRFTITPRLLALVEQIATLRERIVGASVELAWVPCFAIGESES